MVLSASGIGVILSLVCWRLIDDGKIIPPITGLQASKDSLRYLTQLLLMAMVGSENGYSTLPTGYSWFLIL